MKHICISYRMRRGSSFAETCITLPMEDKKAEEILKEQGGWWMLQTGDALDNILRKLSILQGCRYEHFCSAELDRRWHDGED